MNVNFKGLTLTSKPYKENEKLFSVITQDGGIKSIRAPGADKADNSNKRSLSMFSFSAFECAEKRGYYTLTGSNLLYGFYSIQDDPTAYALACYICEIAVPFAVGCEDNPLIFRLLLNTLFAISEKTSTFEYIKPVYEIKLCSLAGFEPEPLMCIGCGCEIEGTSFFNISEGSSYCESCGRIVKNVALTPISLSVARAVQRASQCDVKKLFSYKADSQTIAMFSEIAERYLCSRIETVPKSLGVYNKMNRYSL